MGGYKIAKAKQGENMAFVDKLKDFGLEIFEEVRFSNDERINEQIREVGIMKTIAALYDGNVKDDEIIRLLNKYWNVPANEAEMRLEYEKIETPKRELELYLKRKGMTQTEIREFFKQNNVSIRLRHEAELRALWKSPDKLLARFQKQK